MARPLNVAIFGVGAMGCLFASRLSRNILTDTSPNLQPAIHGTANIFLIGAWQEQIKILREQGLKVIYKDGATSRHKIFATDTLAEVPRADVVLVLVKSYRTRQIAAKIAGIMRPDSIAVTLQNGLGNFEILAESIGIERTSLGVTELGATIKSPGVLLSTGEGKTYLTSSAKQSAIVKRIVRLFNAAGLPTSIVDHPESVVWGKLAVNAAINPLTALLEVRNGALLKNRLYKKIMYQAAAEVARIASAKGITLPYSNVAERVTAVCRATSNNRSSMLQDISRGAPTEIDAICGAVVQYGKQLSIPTPVNALLLELVRTKQAGTPPTPKQLKSILQSQLARIIHWYPEESGRKSG